MYEESTLCSGLLTCAWKRCSIISFSQVDNISFGILILLFRIYSKCYLDFDKFLWQRVRKDNENWSQKNALTSTKLYMSWTLYKWKTIWNIVSPKEASLLNWAKQIYDVAKLSEIRRLLEMPTVLSYVVLQHVCYA